ncbi:hypothetical protein CASFOL_022786 [Castilleja foliolosa]|uniref:Peptidase S9A N-terminal domain-containing protein n=1 Tax=Castilleja foliolosa TaxID=1961234 RepID=A0ABD3CVZ6_9LAMI
MSDRLGFVADSRRRLAAIWAPPQVTPPPVLRWLSLLPPASSTPTPCASTTATTVISTWIAAPTAALSPLSQDPDSEETKGFVEKQMKLTDYVLKTCKTREKLREKLAKLYDFPKYDAPFRAGDKYCHFHNTGLQPQRVLYIQDSLEGEPEVLLDPNTLSDDGTIALNAYAVSEDAKYLAYGISYSGSDWVTIKVMKIEDRSIEHDTVSWVEVRLVPISGLGFRRGGFMMAAVDQKIGRRLGEEMTVVAR